MSSFSINSIKTIHFIGICGVATGALAQMFAARGFKVAGSDSGVYPPMSDSLAAAGIRVESGYDASRITAADLVIVGNVVSRGNPEVEALLESDIPYLSLPDALARFFIADKQSLVITGTHGKTTTTSLLAWLLEFGELEPSMMVGGVARNFGGNWKIGDGDFFVVEGDEYDSAFFDKGPKFLHYKPKMAALTSLEFDHADIYDDFEQYRSRFEQFIRLIPADGFLAAYGEDEKVRQLIASNQGKIACEVLFYGENPNESNLVAGAYSDDGGEQYFDVSENGKKLGRVRLKAPGRHNALNALAAFALARRAGLGFDQFSQALPQFKSVGRRAEIVGEVGGVTIIDDFAHHPTAVRETLSALRRRYPNRRLIAVFEPRSNTSRRNIHHDQFSVSFDDADISIIAAVDNPGKIPPAERLDTYALARDIALNSSRRALTLDNPEAIAGYLLEEKKAGDVIVLMSNGSFGGLSKNLPKIFSGEMSL